MRIVRHRLVGEQGSEVPFVGSPNRGGELRPSYLVMHFTAGSSAAGSISWLCDPQAQASAHVVIGRDGSITQLIPFNRVAWHAGRSTWYSLTGLNQYAIGIELDNAGKLVRHGDRWRSWFGQAYDPSDVLEATHRNESEPAGWHLYTSEQLMAASAVAALLVERYDLRDVLGHDDIAPVRKSDPGPAFPMASFRGRVLGRRVDAARTARTTPGALSIRSGPAVDYPELDGSPLARGTEVVVHEHHGSWTHVELLAADDDPHQDLEGWVASRYLEPL